jgi:squalene-hopene/tetraprenyl-beta-curcumene cyclase
MRKHASIWLVVVALAVVSSPNGARADTEAADAAIDRGLSWLTSEIDDKGGWRTEYGPGITGLVVAAYLRQPGGSYTADSAEVATALDWLASLQQDDGSIFDADSQLPLPNYNTSTALMALSAAKSPKYADVIRRAQGYLMQSQTDEGDGATPEDSNYGGIGYASNPDVRDLSNLTFALVALQESGAPEDAEVWGKAVKFLERVQNNSETNDQDYAGDDGGFIYSPGKSKAGLDSLGRPRSYSSMTYAGLLSFIYANVSKDDPRVQAAHGWLSEHWSMDENYPIGKQGLYYGYHTMAKALAAFGEDTIETSDGETVRWFDELSDHLLSLQTPDGFWPPNDADRWYEGDPVLVTAYSLLALEAGRPTQ